MPRRRNESVPRLLESPEDGQQLLGPVDRHVGRLLQFGRTLAGNDRDANGELQPVEGAKAVEVGRVVTREEGTPRAVRVEQVPNGGPLARVERGEDLQDLPAEASDEARGAGPCGDSFQLRTWLEETLKREPRHFGAFETLSRIAENRKDWKSAYSAWQKVLEIDPKTPGGEQRLKDLRRRAMGEQT